MEESYFEAPDASSSMLPTVESDLGSLPHFSEGDPSLQRIGEAAKDDLVQMTPSGSKTPLPGLRQSDPCLDRHQGDSET